MSAFSNPPNSPETNPEFFLETVSKIDWGAELSENQTWLKTVIAARVGEQAAVEEVWQEVSLAAFKQKSPIKDITKIAPWLYRVAVTQSLMYRRKMGRQRKLLDRYSNQCELTESDDRAPDPLDWLLRQERRQLVQGALARLPQRDRETLMLKYVHDWSYKEMADQLGVSVAAIQAKLHRARQRLRDMLIYQQKMSDNEIDF